MREVLSSWLFNNSFLGSIIVLIFLGHIIREKKPPTSTLAWVLFLILNPYLGCLFYLLLGSRKYKNEKPFIRSDHSCSASLCNTRSIQIIKNGMHAYSALTQLIKEAKNSIYIETYIFKNDDVGNLILSELTKKAQEGLDVRILLDSFGAHLPGHPSFSEFKRSGGRIQMFLPFFKRPNLRNHRKQIIIDQEIAMIGGMNIGDEYMGPSRKKEEWLDLAIVITGRLAFELEKVFYSDWTFATGERPSVQGIPCSRSNQGDFIGQVVSSGPDVVSDPIYELFLTSFFQARERIWITTPYFIPDEALSKALELAAKRGIDVRICLPQKSNHMLADLGRRTYVQQLWSAGTKIYYYPNMLHAKAVLVDSHYGFIGSANMDARSLLLNYEIGICMYDFRSLRDLEKWKESIFLKSSTDFTKLTFREELIGGVARLFGPLL